MLVEVSSRTRTFMLTPLFACLFSREHRERYKRRVLLGLVATVMAASLSIEPDVECVSRESLSDRLAKAGVTVSRSGAPHVRVARTTAGISVEVTSGATRLSRQLRASSSCGPVERAIALLVSSWVKQLPVPAAKPAPAARGEVALESVAVALKPLSEPTPVTSTEAPSDEPTPAADEPVATFPAADEPVATFPAADEPVGTFDDEDDTDGEVAPAVARAEVQSPPESSATVDLSLLGGASVGATPQVAGTGTLGVTLGFGRLGAGLDLGFESIRAADIAPARVETVSKWATASAVLLFQPIDRIGVDFSAGLRVWHINAVALNVFDSAPAGLWAVGGALTAGGRLRLGAGLSAELRVVVSVRHRPEVFSLEDYGEVMTLEAVQGGLLLGLSWRALGK